MIASCTDSEILWGANDISVTKNLIGVLVVMFDLLITFFFWCSLLALTKFQEVTTNEVNSDVVLPQDYTV